MRSTLTSRPLAVIGLVVAALGVAVANTPGPTAPPDNSVTDRKVAPDAGIQRSKLAASTPYGVVVDSDAGFPVDTVAPGASGHVLVSNGTAWTSATNEPDGPAGGDLFGNYPDPTVTHIRGATLGSNIGSPTPGDVIEWTGSSWDPSPITTSSPLTGGSVAGSIGCQTASGSQAGCLSAANWTTFNGKGSVSSVAAGTGLSASPSPIVGAGTVSLADTAVTPASYGSATQTGTFTVDQQGRLTAASSTGIALPVSALTGFGAVNHFICSTGSAWSPCFASGDGTFDGTGALTLKSVGTASTYGDASHVGAVTTDAQGRVSSASSTLIAIAASQVTSGLATIATSGALTDGTGTLLVAHGGTGLATLTAHALYVGNGASAPTAVGLGTTTKVLHGAAAGDPTFSAVALGADVSGTLPTGNGGIGSDTSATSGYPVWASGVVSFNNAATTLAALGGAPTGGVAGAWLAAGVGGTLTTGYITGSYRTVSNTGKFRNVTCDLGSAGSGSSSAITAKIANVTDSTDLCSGTLMACNSATQAQFDCNASFLAGKNYRLNITAQPCGTGGSGIVCNIEVAQP